MASTLQQDPTPNHHHDSGDDHDMADNHNPITREQYRNHDLRTAVHDLHYVAFDDDDQRPHVERVRALDHAGFGPVRLIDIVERRIAALTTLDRQ